MSPSIYVVPVASLAQDVAALYVTHHFHAFKRYYQAARGDPRSAAAELCRSQLRLLLAAVSTQSAAVRGRLRGAGAVGWLLSEVSIEAELLSLETAKVGVPRMQSKTEMQARTCVCAFSSYLAQLCD